MVLENYDYQYFQGILDNLTNKTNPEIYHFRKGNHPGPRWYLKTVCPMPNLKQLDKLGYGTLWYNLSKEEPDIIKLVPHAYDWHGNSIPYMISVWIEVKYDVIITIDDVVGLEVLLVDREYGHIYYVNNLKQLLNVARRDSGSWLDNPSVELKELDDIEKIANFLDKKMKNKLKGDVAKYIRKEFKLLDGGKKKE